MVDWVYGESLLDWVRAKLQVWRHLITKSQYNKEHSWTQTRTTVADTCKTIIGIQTNIRFGTFSFRLLQLQICFVLVKVFCIYQPLYRTNNRQEAKTWIANMGLTPGNMANIQDNGCWVNWGLYWKQLHGLQSSTCVTYMFSLIQVQNQHKQSINCTWAWWYGCYMNWGLY